jgi:hypothetical protein
MRGPKSETRAYLKLVFSTLMALAFLTSLNALIIMDSLGSNIFQPLQRNIAAVTQVEEVEEKGVASPIVEINCKNQRDTLRVRTKASSARLFFKNCELIEELVNTSNKNEGDIFPLKKRQWTSDFIFLQEGENNIQVQLEKKIQHIEITREVERKPSTSQPL